jgi:oligopeptidase A
MSFLSPAFLPDWALLTPEQVEPDIRRAIDTARARIAAFRLLAGPDLTYGQVLLGLEDATRGLDHAWGLVTHLDSVLNSPALRKAYNALLPDITAFYTSITLDAEVWSVLRAYSQTPEAKGLQGVRARFLEETLNSFLDQGAELGADGKLRLAAINARLAEVTQRYSENVLDSTNAWELVVTDAARLSGLPESALAAARQSAASKGHVDAWRFTLHAPSLLPILTYAKEDSLREEAWSASTSVGRKGDWDNTVLVREILALRQEKAVLLGRADFPDFTTRRRMAGSGARALGFVEDLHARIRDRFRVESDELEAFRAAKSGEAVRALHPWEFAYWSECLRRDRIGFDDEALRPWFPADGVVEGMFRLFGEVLGFRVLGRDTRHLDSKTGLSTDIPAKGERAEGPAVPVWHPEVSFHELWDGDRHLGSFYADWFPRESKRGGAWMNCLRTGGPRPDGSFAPHLGLMCGNFTPPNNGQQALLTHDEVTTVFHEFGHLLHLLLCEVEVESLAGTRVAWDFVELPSQILENWCWHRESLDTFARHHVTGEPIPESMLAQLRQAATFRAASSAMRQLAFGKLDLDLHLRTAAGELVDLDAHWNRDLADWLPRTTREIPAMARRFTHIFGDATGYAAGYYSYKWAEVLDADAFGRFQRAGLRNPSVGREFRASILARGNAVPPERIYRDFMGRDPDPEALLVRDGLA